MFGTLENRDFYRHFFISLGVHVLLILIAYLGGSVIVDVFHLNQNVEIIRASVRVDVVGMPKFTVQELKTIQAEAVPKAEPEPKGEEVEKKAKIDSPDLIKKDDLVIQEKGEKKKSSFMSLISDYSSKKSLSS